MSFYGEKSQMRKFLILVPLCVVSIGQVRADDKDIISLTCTLSDRKQKFDIEIVDNQISVNGGDLSDVNGVLIKNQFILFDRHLGKRSDHWRIDRSTGAFVVYSEALGPDEPPTMQDDPHMADDPPVIDASIPKLVGKVAAAGTCQKASRLF
jgi:hypothetical protein